MNDRSWPKSAGRCQAGFDPKQTLRKLKLARRRLKITRCRKYRQQLFCIDWFDEVMIKAGS